MNENQIAFIQEQIGGYRFNNPGLLEQAFTRRSYSEENGGENNEVLEFIGDRALDITVVRYLSEKYGTTDEKSGQFRSNLDESDLTELKRRLVERSALADRIDWLDLSAYLIMGEGDRKNRVDQKDSVREDLFEAIFGAVALDCNWDSATLVEVFQTMHEPESYLFDDDRENFISLIQEWTLHKQGTVPYFYYDRETARYGCSNMPFVNGNVIYCNESRNLCWTNAQQYYCLMKLGDYGTFFVGYGNSKSEARKSACKTAYEYIKKNHQWFSIKDEIDEPDEQLAINQLEILARRDYFDLPEYKYTETHDKNGNPIWQVTCMIDDVDKVFNATDSSKKKAKKKAALKMLEYVLEYFDEED